MAGDASHGVGHVEDAPSSVSTVEIPGRLDDYLRLYSEIDSTVAIQGPHLGLFAS